MIFPDRAGEPPPGFNISVNPAKFSVLPEKTEKY